MSGLRGLELGRTFSFQSQPFSWRGIESFVHPSKELSILQHSRTIVYRSEKNILISVNNVRSLSTSLLRFASAAASASASARDETSADTMSSSPSSSSSSGRLTATGSTSAEALSSEPSSNHPADSSAAGGAGNASSSSASAISTPPPPALPPRLSITGEQFLQAQGKIQELGEKLGKIQPLDHCSTSSSAEWSSASDSSSSSLPSTSLSSPSYISLVEKSLSSDLDRILDRRTRMQRHGAKLGYGLLLLAAVMLRIAFY